MHDRNGTPIQVGDVVLVKAKVTESWSGLDFCNVQLTVGFEKEHGPDNVTNVMSLNSRQVVLHERPAE